jgi:Spy/CpxP family protein refolding chaperone
MAIAIFRPVSATIKSLLAATLLLAAGSLFAQTEPAEPAQPSAGKTCPHADTGSCPHGIHGKGAHGKPMHGGPAGAGPLAMFERMGDELGLSEPQKQELAALMQMYRPRIMELGKRGQENSRALLEMAPGDPAYNRMAYELSQQAGASAAELVTLLSELQANAYALLTNEQQSKFMALRAEQRERMEQRKAEMEARREAGEPVFGPGHGHAAGGHQCKACAWLEADDKADDQKQAGDAAQ